MRYLLLLALLASGCGGGARPETTADPARGLRALSIDDPEVSSIAVVAATSIPSGSSARTVSGAQPMFAGVYVNGRKAREASDAVIRVTGMLPVASTRPPTIRCTSSSGGEVPCPRMPTTELPPTYMFDEVRATADSAYVGFSETSDRAQRSSCITLTRSPSGWRFLSSSVIAIAKDCGK